MHADQHWSDLGIGPLLSLPTLAKLGTTGEVPQTLAHARVELSRMHTCECRASSQHRHASDVGLHGSRRRRARQTHGRVRLAETGVGIRGNNPHLKHALERRQYPFCGCEILSVYPPTDYTRQQRSAYGHTHADRPSASKCRRLLGKLEAARRTARGSRAAPFARRPPVRACVRDIRRGHESASG